MKKIILASLLLTSLGAAAQVTIEIPDFKINNTIFKRKITENELRDNIPMKFVSMTWDVSFYADSIGTDGKHYYGQKIENEGIRTYQITTTADNRTMVNPTTGAIVVVDSTGAYPAGSIGQFDYFRYIAKNVSIKLDDLKRAYGASIEW